MADIFQKIRDTIPMGEEWGQFEALLTLPDEQFDTIYPDFKAQMEKFFKTKNFQNEILSQIAVIPVGDIEEEKKSFESFLEELKADDTLSNNKKDLLISFFETSILAAYEMYDNPREKVTVKIERITPDAKIPEYAHKSDAGADVFSTEETTIMLGETKIIKTGIKIAIPAGYEIQVRPRSGLSAKTGLRIANAPGTIDSNYRGEIGIILTNIGPNAVETVHIGDKIAQLVIAPTPMIKWEESQINDETDRGTGGFGSTDKKES